MSQVVPDGDGEGGLGIMMIWMGFTDTHRFKKLYDALRGMKTEVEHVQHLLQKSKVQIQREFEEWWEKSRTSTVSTRALSPRAAWHTPLLHPSASQGHTPSVQASPPNTHRLRCHQEAIAAQFSHLQQSTRTESQSSSEHAAAKDRGGGDSGGGIQRAMKQRSLYQSSWQQANSISPPVESGRVGRQGRQGGGNSTTSPPPPPSNSKSELKYNLSKKKHVFPADTDHDLNSHSVRLDLVQLYS